jgi:murein DD-endopeptidase MepM/ murein hydrolase activator NlpD
MYHSNAKAAMIQRTMTCAAALAAYTACQAQTVTINASNTAKLEDGGKVVELGAKASQVTWSPDGSRFGLISDSGEVTVYVKGHSTPLFSVASASNPVWSRLGGDMLVFQREHLIELDASGHQIADFGEARPGTACWSPDGKLVAFGQGDRLLVTSANSKAPRQIVKGRTVKGLSWSPDGSALAFSDAKGSLLVVRPNGKGLTQIASAPLTNLSWSGNSRFVLGNFQGYWMAVARTGRYSESVQCDPIATPTWTGGQRLIVVQSGSIKRIRVAYSQFTQEIGKVDQDLKRWAPAPQTSMDNDLLEGQMSGIRGPRNNEIRLNGYIEESDPEDGSIKMVVNSIVDSRGWESNFAQPILQRLISSKDARQTDGSRSRKLQPGDLRQDDRISVVATGGKLDATLNLPLQEVQVEGEQIVDQVKEAEFFEGLSTGHLRSPDVEYDGITRQKVVVPMVFPVIEQVHYIDSFLSSRGGGNRRHHGQDLMGRKMMRLVACFSGTVRLGHSALSGNSITLTGDNGWQAFYCHLNDDTPGTQDCSCGAEYTFAPGLVSGMRVYAGQFLGYMGNSGDAKTTAPHLHFELKDLACRAIVNATGSLRNATHLGNPSDNEVAYSGASSLSSRGDGGRGHRSRVSQATRQFEQIVARYASQSGLDPELVMAVIEVESQGNPACQSGAGACGLMQLMPGTWSDFGVQNPFDPEENIRAGVAYLSSQYRRFHDVQKALTAYNAGPGRVIDGSWSTIPESAQYAKRVMAYYGDSSSFTNPAMSLTVTQRVAQDSAAQNPPAPRLRGDHALGKPPSKTVTTVAPPKPTLTPEQTMVEAIRSCVTDKEFTVEQKPELDQQAKTFLDAGADDADPNAVRMAEYPNTKIVRFSSTVEREFKQLWIVYGRGFKGKNIGVAHLLENGRHRWAIAVEITH